MQDMHVTVAILETREITDLVVPPLRNDIFVDLTGLHYLFYPYDSTKHTAI